MSRSADHAHTTANEMKHERPKTQQRVQIVEPHTSHNHNTKRNDARSPDIIPRAGRLTSHTSKQSICKSMRDPPTNPKGGSWWTPHTPAHQ